MAGLDIDGIILKTAGNTVPLLPALSDQSDCPQVRSMLTTLLMTNKPLAKDE